MTQQCTQSLLPVALASYMRQHAACSMAQRNPNMSTAAGAAEVEEQAKATDSPQTQAHCIHEDATMGTVVHARLHCIQDSPIHNEEIYE